MSEATERLLTLDGLRGVAVMGIVLMNVGDFAAPQLAYLQPLLGGRSPADIAVWLAEFVFADGKFRNLFSLLFGASMLLVADRAEAAGRSAIVTHYSRMAWLFVFGIAHLYLLWWGDILHHYALIGAAAFVFRRHPPHALVALAIVILLLDLLLLASSAGGLWSLRAAATAPDASAAAIAAWRDMSGPFKPADASALLQEIDAYRGSYATILGYRIAHQAGLPFAELLAAGPETFALMLLGMAALRSGFLTGGWSRGAYWRVVVCGYGLGLPVMAALAAWCVATRFDPLVCFAAILACSLPVRAAIMAAHAALLILWFTRGHGALRTRIVAAGRMAFTNYIMTSVVLGLVFYGYGLGWYAASGRAAWLLPVALVWLLMLLWSAPWLDRFAYGPLEWLWRSLARWEMQPFRRSTKSAIARRSQ